MPLRAQDTVAADTPAFFATSLIVTIVSASFFIPESSEQADTARAAFSCRKRQFTLYLHVYWKTALFSFYQRLD